MKTRNIIGKLVLTLLIVISLSSLSFAYMYVCLSQGEAYPTGRICTSDCCANLCVTDDFEQAAGYHCTGEPGCQCTNGEFSNDHEDPIIQIIKPVMNNAYDSRIVPFEINIPNDVVHRLDYQEVGEERRGWVRLCPSKCSSYAGSRSFSDGEHTLTLRAVDGNSNVGTNTITFFVDSYAPRIRSINPKDGEFSNGIFSIEYAEMNVVSISLFYKDSSMNDFTEVPKLDCPSGSRETCEIEVDNLAQGDLEYYFSLTDKAQTIFSDHQDVIVDSVKPILTVDKPDQLLFDSRKVDFFLSTNELSSLYYMDLLDRSPKPRRLCSNCDEYDRAKSFRDGDHEVEFSAMDEAGNEATITKTFTIDSRAPRISRSEPKNRKYGNGLFTVTYNEENPARVTLYYSYNGVDFFDKDNFNCEGGRNAICEIEVTDLEEGQVFYYFEVEDIVGNTYQQRRPTEIMIDTIDPVLTVTNPEDMVYETYRVPFTLESDEEVTFEYMVMNSARPTWKRLCSRCTEYDRERSFAYGEYEVKIRAVDAAGNEDFETFNFETVRV